MIDTGKQNISGMLHSPVSRKECTDTGMAAVLICLIAYGVTDVRFWLGAAVVLLLVNMVWPGLYTYPAKLWLGLSGLLGSIMSKILLTVIFFVVQTPLAVLRRVLGHDPMLRKKWKNGSDSVFAVRDHVFTAEEIERPY
jgi:hypothetical protein